MITGMVSKTISIEKVRWLIAETLVVVLGILIALGLDDYRTAQFEQRLAIEYIERMEDDLRSDLDYIANVWEPVLQRKRQALDSVAPVIREKHPVPDDIREFLYNVSLGGALGTSASSWYTDLTFRDLRATGNLRLLRDPDIRAAISSYYERVEAEALRVERRFTGYVAFVHSVLPGELRADIDMDSLEQFGIEYALERVLTDEFRSLANQEYNLMLFMENRNYAESAKSLLVKLETYRTSLQNE